MAKIKPVYVSNEAIKESRKLDDLVQETSEVIYEIQSIFPFQLFPDRIIIDHNKITIIRKDLFFKRVFPIDYSDILTVKVDRSLVFASIVFEVKRLDQNPRPITFLSPREATIAKKYITGILTAKKAGVDLSKLGSIETKKRLKKIGTGEDEAETLF
jgi:hypothetical protein